MATLSEEVERPPTTAEVTHLQERLRSGSGRPPPSVELVTAALLRAREQAASARAACRLVQGVPTSGYSVKRVGELAELIIPLLPNLGSVDSASPCRPVAAAPSSVPKRVVVCRRASRGTEAQVSGSIMSMAWLGSRFLQVSRSISCIFGRDSSSRICEGLPVDHVPS